MVLSTISKTTNKLSHKGYLNDLRTHFLYSRSWDSNPELNLMTSKISTCCYAAYITEYGAIERGKPINCLSLKFLLFQKKINRVLVRFFHPPYWNAVRNYWQYPSEFTYSVSKVLPHGGSK